MKQRITADRLKELTELQQEQLKELYFPNDGDWIYRPVNGDTGFYGEVIYSDGYQFEKLEPEKTDLPLLTVGQMIEIIENQYGGRLGSLSKFDNSRLMTTYHIDIISGSFSYRSETVYASRTTEKFADVLWAIIKKIL